MTKNWHFGPVIPPILTTLGNSGFGPSGKFSVEGVKFFFAKKTLYLYLFFGKSFKTIGLFVICEKAIFHFFIFYPYFTAIFFKNPKITQNGSPKPHESFIFGKGLLLKNRRNSKTTDNPQDCLSFSCLIFATR